MKKYILVDFPDGFEPPDKFDGVEDYGATGECEKCPFFICMTLMIQQKSAAYQAGLMRNVL